MADNGLKGRCLCGAITYRTDGPPKWTALCHCASCRRACSAPVVAWMGFEAGQVHWSGARRFLSLLSECDAGLLRPLRHADEL